MSNPTAPTAHADLPLYRLRGVERRYLKGEAEVTALRGVDLDVAKGEFVCIEGPSGSGKSTLLQLLGALDKPSSGTVELDGEELGAASEVVLTGVRNKRIGFVFQHFNLIPTLSASENVAAAMAPHHPSRNEREERARELLTRVGLGHRLKHLPSRMSGGEQQRVAIARALCNEPEVIVADEPTGNLDGENAGEVMRILVGLQHDGVTVVVATHDPEVAKHATRHVKLRDGAIVEDGSDEQDGSDEASEHAPRHVMVRDGAIVEGESDEKDGSNEAPEHAPRHLMMRDGAIVEVDSPQHAPRHLMVREISSVEPDTRREVQSVEDDLASDLVPDSEPPAIEALGTESESESTSLIDSVGAQPV